MDQFMLDGYQTNNDGIKLSDEQQAFIDKVKEGKNVLVDACIGSGKTTAIQHLCNVLPRDKRILYLTYNRLLKLDAKAKIKNRNVTVTNYHGFAYMNLKRAGISPGLSDSVIMFNNEHPPIAMYDLIVIDEYQDIETELAEMLEYIKSTNPNIQIVAVGDMCQKIYDKTSLNVYEFITEFLGDYEVIEFTYCFRLSSPLALQLGTVWEKTIKGVNENCKVEEMDYNQVVEFLSQQNPSDILCLGSRHGMCTEVLNTLEQTCPQKYNKYTVYASISDVDGNNVDPKSTSAIFTTYDSSKGLERKICVVFDFTESYWQVRLDKPQQSYEVLRNIFCVAASRGKERIIFVRNDEAKLSYDTLRTPKRHERDFQDVPISGMFDFKYKEDIEECYRLLDIEPIELDDNSQIQVKSSDGLIDLSPCIGIYQEASFFENYDIDKEIQLQKLLRQDVETSARSREELKQMDVEPKILMLSAIETGQNRYVAQVETPFISNDAKYSIEDRLATVFTGKESVQDFCSIDFTDEPDGTAKFSANGYADVIKDDVVYELKFVTELTHEHHLQCACYMIATDLSIGILWNTRTNTMHRITIPNRNKFMNAVVHAITKGAYTHYYTPSDVGYMKRRYENEEQFCTLSEAAKLLGIAQKEVRELIKSGDLKHEFRHRNYILFRENIMDYRKKLADGQPVQ